MIRKTTNISVNDTVVVYPSCGHLSQDGRSWRIDVCGTVYDAVSVSPRKKLLASLVQRVAKVRPTESEREVFERRIRAFIAPTERGKRVVIRIGEHLHTMRRKTQRNGRFVGKMRLPIEAIDELIRTDALQGGWLNLEVVGPDGTAGAHSGRVRLLDEAGLSVISDIDDTIKVTEVHSRESLIANTFFREFRAIDGMAERYRQWAAEGVAFHYVSSSPWQLFLPLRELFSHAGFPDGTFHLRSFRIREHMVRRFLLIRRRGKVTAIRSIMRQFPRRRFVLVGDSGEKDPEIYGGLARQFPEQVRSILIRQVPHRRLEGERLRKVFRRVPQSCWSIYATAAQLPESLAAAGG